MHPDRSTLQRREQPRPSTLAHAVALAACAARAAAQLDMLQPPPSLPSLPEPPPIQHALFENPIPIIIGAVALALGAYAIASRLGKRRRAITSAGAAALLGLAALALSLAVKTDRERVIAHTSLLVDAVAHADMPALDRLLADDARLVLPGAGAGRTKAEITDWVERFLSPSSHFALESHHVGEVQAETGPGPGMGRTRANVIVTPASGGPSTRFVCMITWRRESDDAWAAIEIEPLWLQGWGEITAGDFAGRAWR